MNENEEPRKRKPLDMDQIIDLMCFVLLGLATVGLILYIIALVYLFINL